MKRKKRTQYGIQAVKQQVAGLHDIILSGSVLAIDPSCVTSASLPGYAWYESGELTESGVVDTISYSLPLTRRLQLLGKHFREEFDEPDILVIEHIGVGGKANMESLIRATGAIISSFETENVISIVPLAWQAFIEKRIPLGEGNDFIKYKEYKMNHKSDQLDAEFIGLAIIELAKEI